MQQPNTFYQQLSGLGDRRSFDKDEDLLREGDTAHALFVVEHGGLRLWHNADGRDVTVQFFLEHQVVSSFESFYLDQPSMFAITAFEPTNVRVIDGAIIRRQMHDRPALMAAIMAQVCHRFIDYTNYFLNRIEEQPEQRYRDLLVTAPELVTRVPKYELASYLGVTPVSLSRIRARIEKSSAH